MACHGLSLEGVLKSVNSPLLEKVCVFRGVLPSSWGAVCVSTALYLIWLHSSLGGCQYDLTTPKRPTQICQHWRLFKNSRPAQIFEPNQNILAFACFRTPRTTCASISFPFSLQDVSCPSRALANLCWKWSPSPRPSLKRHHWYCSIHLPQALIAPAP